MEENVQETICKFLSGSISAETLEEKVLHNLSFREMCHLVERMKRGDSKKDETMKIIKGLLTHIEDTATINTGMTKKTTVANVLCLCISSFLHDLTTAPNQSSVSLEKLDNTLNVLVYVFSKIGSLASVSFA